MRSAARRSPNIRWERIMFTSGFNALATGTNTPKIGEEYQAVGVFWAPIPQILKQPLHHTAGASLKASNPRKNSAAAKT